MEALSQNQIKLTKEDMSSVFTKAKLMANVIMKMKETIIKNR